MLFNDLDFNKIMISGAFKKLKQYYYYDKNILFNKMRIAAWESDFDIMEASIQRLAEFLTSLDSGIDYEYLNTLYRGIELVPIPKSFKDREIDSDSVIINPLKENSVLEKVNFFIKAPVELLILDTIWSLMIGKIAYDNTSISEDSYANKINKYIYNNSDHSLKTGINYDTNRFLVKYYDQYSAWREKAFSTIEDRLNNEQDSILVSLDINSFFYSVVFNFDKLNELLNNDQRLVELSPLTNIVKSIHINYTSEMKKYRGNISADPAVGQSAFPLGLFSSLLLSNLYLRELDDHINNSSDVLYYGRYVDDIIIVYNKPQYLDKNSDYIISDCFIKTNILKQNNDSYYLLIPIQENAPLKLQKHKLKIIMFDHSDSHALINLIKEATNIGASMTEDISLPSKDFLERSFEKETYSLGDDGGPLKIRNLSFSSNSYRASRFMLDLNKMIQGIKRDGEGKDDYINKQFDELVKYYKSTKTIISSKSWQNAFSLLLMFEDYNRCVTLYEQLNSIINSIETDNIELIKDDKVDYVIKSLKKTLIEQLSISLSLAIAPFDIKSVINELSKIFSSRLPNYLNVLDEIEINAIDLRKSNMFNNYMVMCPLLNYVKNENDELLDLTHLDLQYISKYKDADFEELLDEIKLKYSPRFIHFNELILFNFYTHLSKGGYPNDRQYDRCMRLFRNINSLDYGSELKKDIIIENISYKNDIKVVNFSLNSNKKSSNQEARIAIASIGIDSEKDVIPVLKNPDCGLTIEKKLELYRMLNEAREQGASMVVFPEYYLPVQWLPDIMYFCRKNKIIVVSGLRYICIKDNEKNSNTHAFNYVAIINPSIVDSRYVYAVPIIREKTYYAPEERKRLGELLFSCKNPEKVLHVINTGNYKYSDLMCYELTNIEYRYLLRGRIELLLIPENNKDTNYFSSIVDSASRDLHCFIIQVNTSQYGDSRITGPYKTLYKDIAKIKGGDNDLIIIGSAKYGEIIESRNRQGVIEFDDEKKCQQKDSKKPKEPPAGFSVIEGV